jgi:hypothetical protein
MNWAAPAKQGSGPVDCETMARLSLEALLYRVLTRGNAARRVAEFAPQPVPESLARVSIVREVHNLSLIRLPAGWDF